MAGSCLEGGKNALKTVIIVPRRPKHVELDNMRDGSTEAG